MRSRIPRAPSRTLCGPQLVPTDGHSSAARRSLKRVDAMARSTGWTLPHRYRLPEGDIFSLVNYASLRSMVCDALHESGLHRIAYRTTEVRAERGVNRRVR